MIAENNSVGDAGADLIASKLSSLQVLKIGGSELTKKGVQALTRLTRLTKLSICRCFH